jgi:DNA polymerase IV
MSSAPAYTPPAWPRTVDPDGRLDWLFLDLNSYFASVEQQDRPELRGRPVAVVPVETDRTCAIAASYEARPFGIRTGTMIHEARQKCPGLVCVLARHDRYAEYHTRIRAEIENHLPVTHVVSIDEVACQLIGSLREPAAAEALARRIKRGLRENIGEHIRCSIGLSTNRFLAKLASDLQKPDGLVTLHPRELPARVRDLRLTDLCGISGAMQARLFAAGIWDMEALWAAPLEQLRRVWGGIPGERFWFQLRGVELPSPPTQRGMIGHSHVLGPENRTLDRAEQVLRRLTLKAAARLRQEGFYTTLLQVSVRLERGPRVTEESRFAPLCDSPGCLGEVSKVWLRLGRELGPAVIKQVAVSLLGLVPADRLRQLDLFPADNPAALRLKLRRERLSQTLDAVNRKLGRDTLTVGLPQADVSRHTGAKIAFNRVPEAWEFQERQTQPDALLAKLARRPPKSAKPKP